MADPGDSTPCSVCTCPDPSDSSLSVAGNILGILTFVTTTLAIVYSYYVLFASSEKALYELNDDLRMKHRELESLKLRMDDLARRYDVKSRISDWMKVPIELDRIGQILCAVELKSNRVIIREGHCGLRKFFNLGRLRYIVNSEEPKALLAQTNEPFQRARSMLSHAESSILLSSYHEQAKELEKISAENGETRRILGEMSDQLRFFTQGIRQGQNGHGGDADGGVEEDVYRTLGMYRESGHTRGRASSAQSGSGTGEGDAPTSG